MSNMFERALAVLSPGWALRRMQARATLHALSTYAAADQGRRNKDWKPPAGSADLAVINDSETLNKRARALVRDSWVARSAIRSFSRNVIGRGITPIPVPRTARGLEMPLLANAIEKEFWEWASRPGQCDAEQRCTFWLMQARAVEELVTVGEHFVVWSFDNTPGSVGLRLRGFEPEQLRLDATRNTSNGNEIRGGIEVNDQAVPVAYWLYDRNPADYLPGTVQPSVTRYPRANVLHLYRPDRVQQTRGCTWLAPVMQRIRDYHRRDDAEMWAAIMEACIGLVVTRGYPTALAGSPTLPRASGDTGQTASGLRTADFVPGMLFEGMVGEEVKPFTPSRPGGTYEPYARMNLRGVGAGIGASYEQIARDFSQGTYSSQRQGLLEDRREWRQIQDLVVHSLILPIYELWVRFASLSGRIPLDPGDFARDPVRYCEAEYVADGHEWIDPEKEVNAYATALAQRLVTRKEIIAARGGRLRRTWEELAEESRLAEELGITLPEDAAAAPAAQEQNNANDDGNAPDDGPGDDNGASNGDGKPDGQDVPAAVDG